MVSQSKPCLDLWKSVPYSCYEVGHTWEPSCILSFLKAFESSFKNGLKLMVSFYLADIFVKSFKRKLDIRKEAFGFFRSTLFIAATGSFSLGGFCLLRHILGKFYGWHSFVVALFVGYTCLSIERTSRRKMIAMYLLPTAIEIIYKMGVCRGLVKPIPYGEVLLFCIASSGFIYFFRTAGQLPEHMHNVISFFVGVEEGMPVKKKLWSLEKIFFNNFDIGKVLLRHRFQEQKHYSCPHKSSCINYVLQGFLSNFLFGFAVDFFLHCYRRATIKRVVGSLHLSRFLSCYVAVFRMSSCILRWLRKKDSPSLHGAVSGALAGMTAVFYKSSTVSLHLIIKFFEVLLTSPASQKYIPHIKYTEFHLFALSLGIILHAAYLEPHTINPKLWKLFCSFSGEKFQQMFRKLLDVYGTEASTLYPNFVPQLQKQFVISTAVKEMLIAHGKW